jgi:hypothetical protein
MATIYESTRKANGPAKEADANEDGKLSHEERKTLKALMKSKFAEITTRIDKNGDGKVSDEELQAATNPEKARD